MKLKTIFSFLTFFAISTATLFAQNPSGKWIVKMDADRDAGEFKNKDIAVIEFKQAEDRTYYFVVDEVKNNYTKECTNCPGDMKSRRVDDKKTQWGKGFAYNPKERVFTGGTIVEPSTGKTHNVKMRMIDENNIEFFSTYKSGDRKGQERYIELTRTRR